MTVSGPLCPFVDLGGRIRWHAQRGGPCSECLSHVRLPVQMQPPSVSGFPSSTYSAPIPTTLSAVFGLLPVFMLLVAWMPRNFGIQLSHCSDKV